MQVVESDGRFMETNILSPYIKWYKGITILGAIRGSIYDSFDNNVITSANATLTYIFHNAKRPLY